MIRLSILHTLFIAIFSCSFAASAQISTDEERREIVEQMLGIEPHQSTTFTVVGQVGRSSHGQNIGEPCRLDLTYQGSEAEPYSAEIQGYSNPSQNVAWKFGSQLANLGLISDKRFLDPQGNTILTQKFSFNTFGLYGEIDYATKQVVWFGSNKLHPALICMTEGYQVNE